MPPKIKTRRNRRIPSGYLVGRLSGGHGDEELLRGADLLTLLAQQGLNTSGITQAGFGFNEEGLMLNNELLGSGVFSKDVLFPSSVIADSVTAQTAAASNAVFNVKTGSTIRATITFLAGSLTGVVAWSGGQYTLPAGTVVSLYAPSPADTNLGWVTGLVEGDVK